jgi:hypothetical protein
MAASRGLRLLLASVLALIVVSTPLTAQIDLPGGHFLDDNGNVHEPNIEAIAIAGITAGCNEEGTAYCPEEQVNRAQMATFLTRALDLPAGSATFGDVSDGNVHGESIAALASAGITAGCEPGLFCPWDPVTRAQMASFLARALDLPPSSAFSFDDVAESGGHGPNITAIAAAGITVGCSEDGRLFCPAATVTRAQMASFLARALELAPVEVGSQIELFPPGVTCESEPRDCTAAVTVDSEAGLYVLEGFFYQLPYLAGDAASFADAEFRLYVEDAPISGLVEHPTTTFGSTIMRVGGVTFDTLTPGAYDFVAEWWWEGELLISSAVDVTISG